MQGLPDASCSFLRTLPLAAMSVADKSWADTEAGCVERASSGGVLCSLVPK